MKNFDLKNLFNTGKLSGFFSSSKKIGWGIDIGGSGVKIVKLEKNKGSIFLADYLIIKIKESSFLLSKNRYQLVREVIREALKDVNWEIESANVAVPAGSSLFTTVDFQGVSDEEINQQIQLEASKYIPIPLEEVIYGWEIVDKSLSMSANNNLVGSNGLNENNSGVKRKENNIEKKVVIVAVMKDISRKYEQAISACEIAIDVLEVDVFSLARCLGRESSSCLIIDFGGNNVSLAAVLGRQPILLKNLELGGRKITDLIAHYLKIDAERAEKIKRDNGLKLNSSEVRMGMTSLITNSLKEEVSLMRDIFNRDFPNNQIDKIIITGGGSQMIGLRELLESELKMPVQVGDVFGEIVLPEQVKEKIFLKRQELSVAVGLALLGLRV